MTNPGDKAAQLSLRFLSPAGKLDKTFTVGQDERISIAVNDQVPWHDDVYTVLDSSAPVAAERMLYFNRGHGFSGASLAAGQEEGSTRYYFAEGSTRPGFE